MNHKINLLVVPENIASGYISFEKNMYGPTLPHIPTVDGSSKQIFRKKINTGFVKCYAVFLGTKDSMFYSCMATMSNQRQQVEEEITQLKFK